MGILDVFRPDPISESDNGGRDVTEARAELAALQENEVYLAERIAELELALEDKGWRLLERHGDFEFSRDALDLIVRRSRLMRAKNPLIKRAVNVVAHYTWAQGVEVGDRDSDVVNEVLQAHMDDRGNRTELWGHAARTDLDRDLTSDGNVFVALWTDPTSGRVSPRIVPVAEVRDIVTDPDDRATVWYYKRRWVQSRLDLDSGTRVSETVTAWYPALWFDPARNPTDGHPDGRPDTIGGHPVHWDAPVVHMAVGRIGQMRWGIPPTYAALDWAKAYKAFLEDWATLVRALSRFAFQWKTKGRNVASRKATLDSTMSTDSDEGNPPPLAGSTLVTPDSDQLVPVPKTGATVDAESGKPLRLMVGAALDLPDTILSGDVDQGNLATARTLDRPTELAMTDRRELWAGWIRDILTYVVAQAARAPTGALRQAQARTVDRPDGTTAVELDGAPVTIEVDWPDLTEHSVTERVTAIVQAATLGGDPDAGIIPPDALTRRLLTELGFESVDELAEQMEILRRELAARADAGQADEDDEQMAETLAEVAAAARALLEAHGAEDRIVDAITADDRAVAEAQQARREADELRARTGWTVLRDEHGTMVGVTPTEDGS